RRRPARRSRPSTPSPTAPASGTDASPTGPSIRSSLTCPGGWSSAMPIFSSNSQVELENIAPGPSRRVKLKLAGLAAGVVALAVFGVGAATARADGPTLGADGMTAPTYSYADAIRERVFVPVANVDQDGDGKTDRVAIDIVRPKESSA